MCDKAKAKYVWVQLLGIYEQRTDQRQDRLFNLFSGIKEKGLKTAFGLNYRIKPKKMTKRNRKSERGSWLVILYGFLIKGIMLL